MRVVRDTPVEAASAAVMEGQYDAVKPLPVDTPDRTAKRGSSAAPAAGDGLAVLRFPQSFSIFL
jgi:hypothetical protein